MNRAGPCVSFASAAVTAMLAGGAAADEPCRFPAGGQASVAAIRDGRTLLLTDGREVRLAAIETADDKGDALRSLVASRTVRLEQMDTRLDRYGRVIAFVYTEDMPRSIQHALVAHGHARVSARIGNKACAEELLDTEREARNARRGIWADPNFAPLPSHDLTRISAARGRFALVEGRVLSVREAGATIYLNFGRRWTRDFALTVLKRRRRDFAAAGIDLKDLEGRRIRVRGWVELRSGPQIEATEPAQIEIVN